MMEIKKEAFRASLPIQIRFNDIDALGHINNNVYFSYFDLGKTTYLEEIRPMSVSWTQGLIVVAHIDVDFFAPVYYKEKIAVESKVIKLGDKSGVFLQQIRNMETNEVKCRCQSVFVTYDALTQSSIPVPDDWRTAISEYEGVELRKLAVNV